VKPLENLLHLQWAIQLVTQLRQQSQTLSGKPKEMQLAVHLAVRSVMKSVELWESPLGVQLATMLLVRPQLEMQ
jgi:hypothetical protein